MDAGKLVQSVRGPIPRCRPLASGTIRFARAEGTTNHDLSLAVAGLRPWVSNGRGVDRYIQPIS